MASVFVQLLRTDLTECKNKEEIEEELREGRTKGRPRAERREHMKHEGNFLLNKKTIDSEWFDVKGYNPLLIFAVKKTINTL